MQPRPALALLWLLPALLPALACSQRPIFTPVEDDSVGDEASSSSGSDGGDLTTTTTTSETGETGSDTGPVPDLGEACEEPPPPPDPLPELPPGCEPVFLNSCDLYGPPSPHWSGWVVCNNGDYPYDAYRLEAVACLHPVQDDPCSGPNGSCSTDADCSQGESCLGGVGYCFCQKPCMSDADCGADELCLCASKFDGGLFQYRNACIPADCRQAADCGPETLDCRLDFDLCLQPESAHCSTPADDCQANADCPDHWCDWDNVDMLWTCDSPAICE